MHDVCVPFSSACALAKHRKGSDSEKLSFEPEAHQPLAELTNFLWHQRKKRAVHFSKSDITERVNDCGPE